MSEITEIEPFRARINGKTDPAPYMVPHTFDKDDVVVITARRPGPATTTMWRAVPDGALYRGEKGQWLVDGEFDRIEPEPTPEANYAELAERFETDLRSRGYDDWDDEDSFRQTVDGLVSVVKSWREGR